jgi:hypothetical protein
MEVSCSVPQWKRFVQTWISQGTLGEVLRFDGERDNKMRTLAIWEAQEVTEREVTERDNPAGFFA